MSIGMRLKSSVQNPCIGKPRSISRLVKSILKKAKQFIMKFIFVPLKGCVGLGLKIVCWVIRFSTTIRSVFPFYDHLLWVTRVNFIDLRENFRGFMWYHTNLVNRTNLPRGPRQVVIEELIITKLGVIPLDAKHFYH